jgi:hypothetical protein
MHTFIRGSAAVLMLAACSLAATPVRPATRPSVAMVDNVIATPAVSGTGGYLLHLPGVGGFLGVDRSLIRGLKQGGIGGEIEAYDWTEHDPGLHALHAYDRNQHEAQLIADKIIAQARAHAGQPFVITSHSGGGAMAVWALERLPADVTVDEVFLIAPALSPGYDLTAALRHVKGKMYVFSSDLDEVLGLGTKMCGTMDGVYTDAAGKIGFTKPDAADPALYAKVVEKSYDSSWIQYGNGGDHVGPMQSPFVAAVVVPLITGTTEAAAASTTRPSSASFTR